MEATSSPMPRVIMAKMVPDFLVVTTAQQRRKEHAGQPAHHGDQHQRNRQPAIGQPCSGVDGQERAQARVHRMAEAQHAALPQQDVVGQAE